MLSCCLLIQGAAASTDPLTPEANEKRLAEAKYKFGDWVTYPGEDLDWLNCTMQDDKLPFECSVVTVPMDHFNETKNDEKFFFIDLIRIRGRDGSPNILTNPGGPGVSGCDDLRESGYILKKLIGEDFHLVSFNPRGVGFAALAVDVNLVESKNTCRLSKQKRSEGVRQSSDHFSSFAKAYSKV